MNFLKDVATEIDNEYAALVSDGVSAGDTSGFIDTGSHVSVSYTHLTLPTT